MFFVGVGELSRGPLSGRGLVRHSPRTLSMHGAGLRGLCSAGAPRTNTIDVTTSSLGSDDRLVLSR
ncbi:hypothetical protein BV20DRAFT_332290 [Pilatotrama ljubarskyi]|nr:hypothetical protein BV20DRAFT_332290 [Pilatotrama ljubarskyi]